MASLDEYFNSPAERAEYEKFCAEQERGLEKFNLDKPALICRWRIANKQVPMLNRHIRALSQRVVNGEPLTHNMLSWAKQHVEWSLAEGSYPDRNGVLMLVIDVNGNAAMSVGAYEPLGSTSADALIERASQARVEAGETRIAPELLGVATASGVVLAATAREYLCGAATLVEQLAQTKGCGVERGLLGDAASVGDASVAHAALASVLDAAGAGAVPFLISDEHGVVVASDAPAGPAGELAAFLADACRKLFNK